MEVLFGFGRRGGSLDGTIRDKGGLELGRGNDDEGDLVLDEEDLLLDNEDLMLG